MQSLVDDNTKAILVNNPSNPCGSVYSKVDDYLVPLSVESFTLTNLLFCAASPGEDPRAG